MTVFDHYSRYYDLLYQDKDYAAEAVYVAGLIRTHSPACQTILELGCGTGNHAELLVKDGFYVHGIDRSRGMLSDAELRREKLPPDMADRLDFSCGDIRDIRIEKQFDAVISIFHVMSYMVDNDDLNNAVATARAHLRAGGLFVFDCWYGPAVFEDRPAVRVKRLSDADVEVTRIADPVMHPNNNVVDVNYEVHILNKQTGTVRRIAESHSMRYLFIPEILNLLSRNGLKPVVFSEWMTGKEPGLDTWSLCVVGKVAADYGGKRPPFRSNPTV